MPNPLIDPSTPPEILKKWRIEFEIDSTFLPTLANDEEGERDPGRFEVDENGDYFDPTLQWIWQGYLLRCMSDVLKNG